MPTRGLGGEPPGRTQSKSTIQIGTVAMRSAASPEGTVCSATQTPPFATSSIRPAMIPAQRHCRAWAGRPPPEAPPTQRAPPRPRGTGSRPSAAGEPSRWRNGWRDTSSPRSGRSKRGRGRRGVVERRRPSPAARIHGVRRAPEIPARHRPVRPPSLSAAEDLGRSREPRSGTRAGSPSGSRSLRRAGRRPAQPEDEQHLHRPGPDAPHRREPLHDRRVLHAAEAGERRTVPSSVFAERSSSATVLARERPAARSVASGVARTHFGVGKRFGR